LTDYRVAANDDRRAFRRPVWVFGWAARYWPAQLAPGGAMLLFAAAQTAAAFKLVEAGAPGR
jgi:hypothetical protein